LFETIEIVAAFRMFETFKAFKTFTVFQTFRYIRLGFKQTLPF